MAIESNAAAGELDSPYYLANKTICENFEAYMFEMGGVTTGSYNAWSYNVKGRVDAPLRWIFQIKKATYTSGTLLVNSEYQSLQFWTIWKCKDLVTELPDFYIRKKKFGDGFRRNFSKSVNLFKDAADYMIISKDSNHPLAKQLRQFLQFNITDKSLLKMTYKENELIIQIDSKSILKEEFKALIQEKFTLT